MSPSGLEALAFRYLSMTTVPPHMFSNTSHQPQNVVWGHTPGTVVGRGVLKTPAPTEILWGWAVQGQWARLLQPLFHPHSFHVPPFVPPSSSDLLWSWREPELLHLIYILALEVAIMGTQRATSTSQGCCGMKIHENSLSWDQQYLEQTFMKVCGTPSIPEEEVVSQPCSKTSTKMPGLLWHRVVREVESPSYILTPTVSFTGDSS